MNPKGGELLSESLLLTDALSDHESKARILNFCKPCYMFIKENDKEKPYFAVKLNINFLETLN